MSASLNFYCNVLPFEFVAFNYRFLKPAEPKPSAMTTTEREILNKVSEILNLPLKAITGKSRLHVHAEARQIAIYLTKKLNPKITWVKLGRLYRRHHSTIIYTINQVEGLMYVDAKYKKKVEQINEQLKHLKATYAS